MKKPRSDSKLDALSPQQKEMLREWLVDENLSYEKAQERLYQDFNVRTSVGALSRFYATQCFSLRSSEAKAFAEQVGQELLEAEPTFDKVTLALVKKRAFEQAAARDGDMKTLEILAGIIGGSAKLQLKKEQLEFSREKFRQELKSDVEKGLDALQAEIKGDAIALELFEKMKARVMAAMEAKSS